MAKQADLLSVAEAQRRVLGQFLPLTLEQVALEDALNRVLARAIRTSRPVPPFANSSMDGFAIRSDDAAGAAPRSPVTLDVAFTVAAGSGGAPTVTAGQAARIMTGAPVPAGADAVVPFEDVLDSGGSITIRSPVNPGACIRAAGQDMPAGKEVLSPGTEIRAPQIGLLATLGLAEVPVYRRPAVAILATGDELVAPGRPLAPGQIYNSNSPMLAAAVREAGATAWVLPVAGDTPEALSDALDAARGADLLITSGGASVGDFDHVKRVLGEAGELGFWRVRLRPGKPLLFGRIAEMPVIGLPGNPTSAMVTFELFARPSIRTMLGAHPFRPAFEVIVDDPVENRGGRRTFARVAVRAAADGFHVRLAGGQDSAMVLTLAQADGLLEIPEDREEVRPGERAVAHLWRLP